MTTHLVALQLATIWLVLQLALAVVHYALSNVTVLTPNTAIQKSLFNPAGGGPPGHLPGRGGA